jgi:sugar phosphate permease
MGWFDPGERGFALALRQTSNPLGGLLAAVCLPPIVAVGGVRAGLLALAGFCAATAIAGAVGLREPPAGQDVAPTQATRSATDGSGACRPGAGSSSSPR